MDHVNTAPPSKFQVDECEAKADEDSYTCTSCCLVTSLEMFTNPSGKGFKTLTFLTLLS